MSPAATSEPRSASSKRSVSLWYAAAILGALAVVVMAARSGRPSNVVTVRGEKPPSEPTRQPPPPPAGDSHSSHGGSDVVWLKVVLIAVAGLAVLALVAYVVLLVVRLIRDRGRKAPGEEDEFGEDVDDPDMPRTPLGLGAVAENAIAELERGATDNAIIACWMRFEDAAARSGMARRPAETAADFTERVLTAYEVDASALARLAELYREARFSRHAMGEDQRSAARLALQAVRDGLLARQSARHREPGGGAE